MRASGQALADSRNLRHAVLVQAHDQLLDQLAAFRRQLQDAAAERQAAADLDAKTRDRWLADLQAAVMALQRQFEHARRDTVGDLHQMASELRAAAAAFRNSAASAQE